MLIYCCECEYKVKARLTNGKEVYPHRKDLYKLPFWICDNCDNFVGCHHKTKNKTKPLGVIPNKDIKKARKEIHKILDPLWKEKGKNRAFLYALISDKLGYEYHTAEIQDINEARKIYKIIKEIK